MIINLSYWNSAFPRTSVEVARSAEDLVRGGYKKSDLWWVFIGEDVVYAMCVNCRYCHYCRFSNRQYRQKRQNRQYVSYLLRVHNGFLTGPTATMTLLCDNYDITMSFSSHCWWINSLPSRQSVLSLSITPNVIRVFLVLPLPISKP